MTKQTNFIETYKNLKPTKTFKMDKSVKTFMSLISDKTERDTFRRAMIDAQLCAAIVPQKQEKKTNFSL